MTMWAVTMMGQVEWASASVWGRARVAAEGNHEARGKWPDTSAFLAPAEGRHSRSNGAEDSGGSGMTSIIFLDEEQ